MALIADTYPYVVGVDTHARSHTYCLIESERGAIVDTASFPTSLAGIRRALTWLMVRTKGELVFAAVEGTSSYGASLTAAMSDVGITVGEIRPGPKSSHAHHGKSDLLDAEAAARKPSEGTPAACPNREPPGTGPCCACSSRPEA